ncbi:MAG TPA: MFS transporter [Actinomycetes bacterium]|nr:MFS transporter [Actinomycetes bacterium]
MSTTATTPAGRPGHQDADPRRWVALAVVLIAGFMQLVDISIVNVAIPSIQRDLDATYSQIQWVLAGYQLAFAVTLITGGRLGDIFGRKRMFMLGMTGFTLASALCGLAQNPGMLIGSRLLQGLMGAVMFPQILAVIQVTFPPRERAAALGSFGATIGLATITGPLVGGLLIEADLLGLGWRPIFLVNVPIGIAALVAATRFLHESRSPQALRLDLVGVGIVSAGLLLLVYPLVQGRDLDWPAWTFLSMAAAVPVLAAFAVWERRKKAADGSPLVEPALFRQRAFVAGLLVAGIFFMGIPAFFLTFTLWLQIGLGFTALHAGLTGIPFAVGSALASAASARLAPRLGRRILSLGTLLLAAGMAGLSWTVDRYGGGVDSWQLIPALAVCGLGLGCVIAPLVNIVLDGIRGQDAGSASGVLTTIQQVGGAVGVAVIGVIFFGLLGSHAAAVTADLAPRLRADLETAGAPAPVSRQVVAGFEACFQDRANAKDPSATPASCQRAQTRAQAPGQDRIGQVVTAAAEDARRQNFSDAFERTLLFEVAVYLVCFLLIFLLPGARGRALEQSPEAAALA